MKRTLFIAAAFGAVALLGTAAVAQQVNPAVSAALADPARPEADRNRDAARKPAEVLAFAGVKPGDKVGELIPGGGYFTRVLSKLVGPSGKVYAITPHMPAPRAEQVQALQALAQAYPNVTVINTNLSQLNPPEKLDVVWTSENYHDFAIPMFGSLDRAAVNKAIFNALKPGGVYYVEDHAAAAGAGDVGGTLHRIDPAIVRREVEAAGFRFDGQSNALAQPSDPKTAIVFDPGIRGKTDKFVMRFRKPA